MNRKLVLALALMLLVGMLTVAFNVQKARASGTIYIRADGSIDPPEAPISTVDNVTYILTGNITSDADGIVIERNNTIVDGEGCELQGPGYWGPAGMRLSGISNVTIKNMRITAFGDGICLAGASGNTLSGNNITNNMLGIRLYAEHNNITGNNIAKNSVRGIELCGSNNTILGNKITNNGEGITLSFSSNNSVVANTFLNDGLRVSGSHGNVVEDNIVNDKPLVYLEEVADRKVEEAGQVILVNCDSIIVENLTLTNTDYGVQLWNTNNTRITNNAITNNSDGISLHWSFNNRIFSNSITDNNIYGIVLSEAENNSIVGNNILHNQYGITASGSSNNSIYHNSFIDNSVQVDNGGTNIWDTGPSGGNYWSDYTGVDVDGNGIGDTSYYIDWNDQDNYPLMNPWTPIEHELVVSIVAPASITLGALSLLNATVSNWGLNDEVAVELLVLINSTTVKSATVPLLQVSSSYTCTYVWTPTVDGIHNITAYVFPVLGETHAENNQGTKFVSVSGFHELEVTSEVPAVLVLGASSLINATVSNHGTYREQNVSFLIFVNNTIVSSTTIPFLETGSSHTIDYTWVPEVEGKFNVTTYAHQVPGETSTENNQKTEFVTVSAPPQVGVKAGDWIKIDYIIAGWPAGTSYPLWLKVEFLSVEGTAATVRVTMHMSDGTEQNATVPVDVVAGGQAFGLSGFVIPANLTTGDIVCMSGYGNVTIAGETTGTYAGGSRTVVHASFSQYGTQLAYYWDKQTGVLVEASTSSGTMTATAKATETNMWQAAPSGLPIDPIYLYVLAALVTVITIGAAAFIVRRRKRQPKDESPQT